MVLAHLSGYPLYRETASRVLRMESFLFLVFFVFIAGRQLFVYCVFAGSAGYGGYGGYGGYLFLQVMEGIEVL